MRVCCRTMSVRTAIDNHALIGMEVSSENQRHGRIRSSKIVKMDGCSTMKLKHAKKSVVTRMSCSKEYCWNDSRRSITSDIRVSVWVDKYGTCVMAERSHAHSTSGDGGKGVKLDDDDDAESSACFVVVDATMVVAAVVGSSVASGGNGGG